MKIAVVTGTGLPFQRLIDAAAECVIAHPEWFIWVQHGNAMLPPGSLTGVPYLPRRDLLKRLQTSDAVVVHCGVGAVLDALSVGRRPIIMPRLRRFGEHVNDHQLELADALGRENLASVVSLERSLLSVLTDSPKDCSTTPTNAAKLRASVLEDITELTRRRNDSFARRVLAACLPLPRPKS